MRRILVRLRLAWARFSRRTRTPPPAPAPAYPSRATHTLTGWQGNDSLVTGFKQLYQSPVFQRALTVLYNARPQGIAPDGYANTNALIELGRRMGYDEALDTFALLADAHKEPYEPESTFEPEPKPE